MLVAYHAACAVFADSAGGRNRRRVIAEAWFWLGETTKADQLYRGWLDDDPQWWLPRWSQGSSPTPGGCLAGVKILRSIPACAGAVTAIRVSPLKGPNIFEPGWRRSAPGSILPLRRLPTNTLICRSAAIRSCRGSSDPFYSSVVVGCTRRPAVLDVLEVGAQGRQDVEHAPSTRYRIREACVPPVGGARPREFPARLRGEELAGVDMVMLDADLAGCVVTWRANHGLLDEGRQQLLARLLLDVDQVVPLLQDDGERAYYERLGRLGRLVYDSAR